MIDTIEEYEKLLIGGLCCVALCFKDYLEKGEEISTECLETLESVIEIYDGFQVEIRGYSDPESYKVFRNISKEKFNKQSIEFALTLIHNFGQDLEKGICNRFNTDSEERIKDAVKKFSPNKEEEKEEEAAWLFL